MGLVKHGMAQVIRKLKRRGYNRKPLHRTVDNVSQLPRPNMQIAKISVTAGINFAKRIMCRAWAFAGLGVGIAQAQMPDVVVADFEGASYGDWRVTGTAFGQGPAQGTLPNQMTVDGFSGHGL